MASKDCWKVSLFGMQTKLCCQDGSFYNPDLAQWCEKNVKNEGTCLGPFDLNYYLINWDEMTEQHGYRVPGLIFFLQQNIFLYFEFLEVTPLCS